ncbi:MAG: hypothetical protein J0I11_08225 [Actinobacteria bacterium]|nr:hypothetical protein [Actinomycetota bacterium]
MRTAVNDDLRAPGADTPDVAAEPTGPRRALITIYGIFALAATARAVVQIATKFHEAPLAYLLSLLSGLVYIGATVGLTTRRRWSRGLAWASCGTEFVGVLVIGTLSLADSVAFPDDTVWSGYGSGYVYIPVVLPLLGLGWLWHTRHMAHPARP